MSTFAYSTSSEPRARTFTSGPWLHMPMQPVGTTRTSVQPALLHDRFDGLAGGVGSGCQASGAAAAEDVRG